MSLSLYNDIRDTFDTGDCILFSGKGNASNVIKRYTNSQYSHCGILVKLSIPPIENPRLFVIESTTLNENQDVIDGKLRRGVQMHLMSQLVDSYDGKIWVKQPKFKLSETEKTKMLSWLLQQHASKIDYDVAQAIAAGIDKNSKNWLARLLGNLFGFNNKEALNKLFCSELVATAYKKANLLPSWFNASEMTPEDVANLQFLGEAIELK